VRGAARWSHVCDLDDIISDTGVCIDLDGKQIAVFRVDECVYALDNFDPASGVNVLSRGIVGDIGGVMVVASPIYKQHFCLATGRCLEEAQFSVTPYPVRLVEGQVWLRAQPIQSQRAAGKRRLVVVGNGMAGMRTVEELLNIEAQTYEIDVFGAEPHGNYNRILLSPVLAGEKNIDEIMVHPLDWYRDHGVRLHAADPIVAIDRVRRQVRSRAGTEVSYDRLLLATGSTPIVLPVAGNTLPGVLTFRDIQDVDAMLIAAREHSRAVVIGGGLLGLEAANGLRCRGMDVTVVHLPETLMERQLDPTAAQLLQASLEKRGLKFKMSAKTSAILGDTQVKGVRFEDGSELAADLIVMAVGIRPNIELAKLAGLRCERGVLVDDTMLTYDPSIYAVGECVQHRNSTYGLVAPLWEQAAVCARQLAEVGMTRYKGSVLSTQLKVTGIDLFSAGDFNGTPHSESLMFKDAKRGVYKRLVIEEGQIRGAVLYGDTKDGPWYVQLMAEGRQIGPLRDKLLFGASSAAN
jgi:NAD(P)H-dependent nitrite reductase large subunit/NAD(P)H-dependent nitrite reductase small subunit